MTDHVMTVSVLNPGILAQGSDLWVYLYSSWCISSYPVVALVGPVVTQLIIIVSLFFYILKYWLQVNS